MSGYAYNYKPYLLSIIADRVTVFRKKLEKKEVYLLSDSRLKERKIQIMDEALSYDNRRVLLIMRGHIGLITTGIAKYNQKLQYS